MTVKRGFASDNNSGVHPRVMAALSAANRGHVVAYGDDPYTRRAARRFQALLGRDIDVFFVFNGTGANVLSVRSSRESFHSVICADSAHMNVDECSAPERLTGCKLIPVKTPDGKLTPGLVKPHLHYFGDPHHAQPGMISITQASEFGTVYTPGEIRSLAKLAHAHGMVLHVDGARIANAAACLNVSLKAMLKDTGVDVLSFGGTKNGMMFGEAVVFFNRALGKQFHFYRKQNMQLASKMRFIAAQFEALLTDDLWLQNARHSNRMAKMLERAVRGVRGVTVRYKVQSNGVFAVVPARVIPSLQKQFFFYVFEPNEHLVRWMASFDTTEDDVREFAACLRKLCK